MSSFAAGLHIDEPQLRIAGHDAVTALRAVVGLPVVSARARLRFGPGRTCESLARLLDRAIVQAEGAGLDPALLVVADGSARAPEDRVDWQWVPPWRPADITDSGREQLGAVGFNL